MYIIWSMRPGRSKAESTISRRFVAAITRTFVSSGSCVSQKQWEMAHSSTRQTNKSLMKTFKQLERNKTLPVRDMLHPQIATESTTRNSQKIYIIYAEKNLLNFPVIIYSQQTTTFLTTSEDAHGRHHRGGNWNINRENLATAYSTGSSAAVKYYAK
jgi:hypothetical protein